MSDYVFYPVSESGSSATNTLTYTWGNASPIDFTTMGNWAVETSLDITAPPSTTETIPGAGDTVALVAGAVSASDVALYNAFYANGTASDPYLGSSSFPVDVVINGGSVQIANLLLAGFGVSAATLYPTLAVDGGTLNITGNLLNQISVTVPIEGSETASGGGTIDINTGGTVIVSGTIANTGSVATGIDFNFVDPSAEQLALDAIIVNGSVDIDNFSGDISGDLAGNSISLPNVAFLVDGIDTTGVLNGNSFVVSVGGLYTISFDVAGLNNASALHVEQSGDGIELVTCFAAGTRIRTPSGDVAIEDLGEGDPVCLPRTDATAPVRWIGRRRIDCRRHPRPDLVWPVRIAAGAFADAMPSRDLLLSPDHAVFVDGVLIPIRHLVDGVGIVQQRRDTVTYYHVELARHDVILAEGLPAETYLDTDDRTRFDNNAVMLHPMPPPDQDLVTRIWDAQGCAPLVVTGPVVAAVRQRLRARRAARPQNHAASAAA